MKPIRNVPFFNYQRLYADESADLLRIFSNVGQRGAFIMQSDLREFEASLAFYTGANHAIGVANATDGLEFALMAIGLRSGDEVIFCSHTMIATASSIVTAGGIPVPVEIGDDNLIDPDAVQAAITPRTVGIMPTQLNGRTCNMDRLMGVAQKNNLFVVEDAAQALGSRFRGRHAGTFGCAGAISFFPAKVLGCLGDGGGVITSDKTLFDKIYQLHDHGRDVKGEVKCWGRNSRLDNLQAAFLQHKLPYYNTVIDRRRRIAAMYEERLAGIIQVKLPPGPESSDDHFDIYQNYEIEADNRDLLKEYLKQQGIGTLVQWGGKAVHQWENLGFQVNLPGVERFFQRCIMLPINMFIDDEDVHYTCDKVIEFYKKSKRV